MSPRVRTSQATTVVPGQGDLFAAPPADKAPAEKAPSEKVWSVGLLTRRIAGDLGDYGPLLVQGELSDFRIAPSGHAYGTLKDRDAQISLTMWKSTVVRAGPLPKAGTQVIVRGSLDVYPPRGSYSLIATRITPTGQGELWAKFEELKRRLQAEGLFDESRKQPLPFLPRAVGLATASGSAALADMLHSLRARFPNMPVVHAPCVVQGPQAAASVVAALGLLDRHPLVDVIIVGRGGGSLEDLWAFNEEPLLRAVAACQTPVVSAVGHETDTTLCDVVADLRAKTPTAAAELVVPVEAELREQVHHLRIQAHRSMAVLVDKVRDRLHLLCQHRALAEPLQRLRSVQGDLAQQAAQLHRLVNERIRDARTRLRAGHTALAMLSPIGQVQRAQARRAELATRLHGSMQRAIAQSRDRHTALAARLHAVSPLAVLARGYSVVHAPGGAVLRSAASVRPGDLLRIRLHHGSLLAKVESSENQE